MPLTATSNSYTDDEYLDPHNYTRPPAVPAAGSPVSEDIYCELPDTYESLSDDLGSSPPYERLKLPFELYM